MNIKEEIEKLMKRQENGKKGYSCGWTDACCIILGLVEKAEKSAKSHEQPSVKVYDVIQICLLGSDNKIYLNLVSSNEIGYCEDYILKDKCIISDEWQPYYEREVKWIEEECAGEPGLGHLTLVI